MTPHQRELARHALGLPNDRRMSYRNRFFAGSGHTDYENWRDMVRAGFAERTKESERQDFFWLTENGAHAALMPGETLDPEDFA